MVKNFLYMFITLAVRLFSNTIIFFLLAKLWGAEGFGLFMYPFTITTLLSLLVDYGFSLKIIKDISEFPNKVSEYIYEAVYSKMILTAISFIIFIPVAITNFRTKEQLIIAVILFVANIMNSYSILFNLSLRALEYFKYETFVSLISNIIYSIIIFILILLEANQVVVSIGIVLSRLFSLLFSIYVYKKKVQPNRVILKVKLKNIIRSLSENFPYAVHLIVGSLYFQIDTLIIHYFLDNEGVGLYQSAMRIIMGALIFNEVISSIFFPKLGNSKQSKNVFLSYSLKMNKYSNLIGLVISTGLFFMSKVIILILYGREFIDVVPILKGLSILLFIRYAGAASSLLLTVADKQKIRAFAAVLALVINSILNYFLIPIYGLNGAVYAGIITAIILNAFYLINTYNVFKSLLLDKSIIFIHVLWILSIVLNVGFKENMFLQSLYLILLILYIANFVLFNPNFNNFFLKRRG
jgi:O-antigen/teichoic acid export membrane protein